MKPLVQREGQIGKYRHVGVRDTVNAREYEFNEDYRRIMHDLLIHTPGAVMIMPDALEACDGNKLTHANFYQVADTCVKISGDSENSSLKIFNKDLEKRAQTTKILEEAFK